MSKANFILEKLIHLTKTKNAVKSGFFVEQLDANTPEDRNKRQNPNELNGMNTLRKMHRNGLVELSEASKMVRLPQHEGRPGKKAEILVIGKDGVYSLREVG